MTQNQWKIVFVLSMVLSSGIGCLHRTAQPQTERFTIIVPPSCLTKDIVIYNCDPSSDPPRCKGPTHVNYKSGCEQVQVNK